MKKCWIRRFGNKNTFVMSCGDQKEIMGLVRNQNDITKCAFSLNRDILKLLENLSDNTCKDIKDLRRIIKDLTITKEIFRYRDWVTKLIQEIVRKLDKLEDINNASAWDIISYESPL
ncbi:unnamed protein product [Rhizophagus irregularis]|nr:unnamed protein product [Rhizophagus irregularis]